MNILAPLIKSPKVACLAVVMLLSVTGRISAQQLYVSNVDVGDGGFNNCDSGTLGTSRSFITAGGDASKDSSLIKFDRSRDSYPGGCLALCAKVVCVSTTGAFGIDELRFEVFKFGAGFNPLDPASTPPIKTVSLFNLGQCLSNNSIPYNVGTYCTAWDGSYSLNGVSGKSDGQFGFRAHVTTNLADPVAGNIAIEQTKAFPDQNQIPMQVKSSHNFK
jgi:hypothetical protein